MDISEFLASMQGDASGRALARDTHMGIPDADNDPQTQDAAPTAAQQDDDAAAPDQSTGDQPEQSFAEGGEVEDNQPAISEDQLSTFPLSSNIEDRRGEPPKVGPDGKLLPSETWADTGRRLTNKLADLKSAVIGQGSYDTANRPRAAGDEEGAIPEDPSSFRKTMGDAIGMRGKGAQQAVTAQGEEGWRNSAHEAVTAGLDYGRNVVHGVNRPVSDESHEGDVKDYLSGAGSMDPNQFTAAQRAVDPQGALDTSSRLQKTLGSIYDFYKKGEAGGGQMADAIAPKAVWGALQYVRKAYDAYSHHAIVAGDKGADEVMAKSAEEAMNKVPDGLLAKVTYLGGAARSAAMEGEPQSVDGHIDMGTPQGAAPASPGRIGMGDPAMSLEGGKFQVALSDPETGKTVHNQTLTKPQLGHALSQGFDRMVEHGTPTVVGGAAQVQPGMEQHPKRSSYPSSDKLWQAQQSGSVRAVDGGRGAGIGPRDPGTPVQPSGAGMAPGTDTTNMSIGEQQRLRKIYQTRQAEGEPPAAAAARIAAESRVKAAEIGAGSRTENNQRTNDTKRYQTDQTQTGLNGRAINSPSQAAQNDRAILNRAAAAAEADLKNDATAMTPEQRQAKRLKLTNDYVEAFRQHAARGQQPQPQAPQPQAPQPQAPQPQQPQQPAAPQPGMEKNGFRFKGGNPGDRNNWERIGG